LSWRNSANWTVADYETRRSLTLPRKMSEGAEMEPQRCRSMRVDEYAEGVFIVAATKDGETEFWTAAVPEDEVLMAVALETGPGWELTITTLRMTAEKAAMLNLPLISVCRAGAER
jgi:hypothetical protein